MMKVLVVKSPAFLSGVFRLIFNIKKQETE